MRLRYGKAPPKTKAGLGRGFRAFNGRIYIPFTLAAEYFLNVSRRGDKVF